MTTNWKVGDRVITEKNGSGAVAFLGETEFFEGIWIGIVLDKPMGKNNGTVKDKTYFTCEEKHGTFVRPDALKREQSTPTKSTGLRAPTSAAAAAKGKSPVTSTGSTPRGSVKGSPRPGMSPSPSKDNLAKATVKREASQSQLAKKGAAASPKSSPKRDGSQSQMRPPTLSAAKTATPASKTTADTAAAKPPPSSEAPKGAPVQRQLTVDAMKERFDSKISSVASSTALLNTTGMSEDAELEYLRGEVTDLGEKLETLRMKRSEDKAKLLDYEKCRVQLQQLMTYKSQMSEAHAQIQRKLQEAQREAQEAVESRETYREEMSAVSETVEMATLDKEMAEERAEILQAELDATKERIEELDIDLSILKEQMDGAQANAPVVTASGEQLTGNAAVQVKQLTQQNDRLREALVKMRDVSTASTAEHTTLLKRWEEMQKVCDELSRANEKLTTANEKYAEDMIEMNETLENAKVDASMGAEQMVEQMTDRNLELEAKVQILEEDVETLDQMKLIDEEMADSWRDAERALREELDMAEGRVQEVRVQLRESARRIKDYETTIGKYRQKTSELQAEIQDLKDQITTLEYRSARRGRSESTVNDEDGDDDSISVGVSGKKSLMAKVAADVATIELSAAKQQIEYLAAFLPDNFVKAGGDRDAVNLNVLLPRLADKLLLLGKVMTLRYPQVPGGMKKEHVMTSHKAEQWAYGSRLQYLLNTITTHVHKFESVLRVCSVERLARVALSQQEIAQQEHYLDGYFNLIASDTLDENSSTSALDKMINYFHQLNTVHMAGEPFDGGIYMRDAVNIYVACVKWTRVEMKRLLHYLKPSVTASPLHDTLAALATDLDELEQCCVRMKSRIPHCHQELLSEREQSAYKTASPPPIQHTLRFGAELCDKLSEAASQLHSLAYSIHAANQSAASHVNMMPEIDGLDLERMGEMFSQSVEKHCALSESNTPASQLLVRQLQHTLGYVRNLTSRIDGGEWEVVFEPSENGAGDATKVNLPPLLERAHQRKQDALDADNLQWELEKRTKEIHELKLQLRSKVDDLSEMRVRYDTAEKRASTSGKDGDSRVVRLTERVEELQKENKKQKIESDMSLDAMRSEVLSLSKDNDKFKEAKKEQSKMQLLSGASKYMNRAASNVGGGIADDRQSAVIAYLGDELDTTRTALRVSEADRWREKGRAMSEMMAQLKPLNVPRKLTSISVTQTAGTVNLDEMTKAHGGQAAQLADQVSKMNTEFMLTIHDSMRIIDLRNKQKTPMQQLFEQVDRQRQLKASMANLNKHLIAYRATHLNGGEGACTDFGQFTSAKHGKSLTAEMKCIGRITIPLTDGKSCKNGVKRIEITQPEQLVFIRNALNIA